MKIKKLFSSFILIMLTCTTFTVSAGESSPVPRISEALAYYFYQKGELPLAMREYRKLATSQNDNSRYHYNLGCLYAQIKDFPQAIQAFKKAGQSEELHRDACYNLAVIYGKYLKDIEEADKFYCRYKESE